HAALLYAKMPYAYAGVRVTITGGSSADGYSLAPAANYLITLQPLAMPPGSYGGAALALKTFAYQRQLPQVKTIDYLMGIRLLQQAKSEGYNEVLYLHGELVAECPRANLFAITPDGVLHTPDTGILQGVTRSRVLRKAATLMPVAVGPLTCATLLTAAEIFTTSTTRVMQRVSQINDTILPNTPNPLATQLYTLLLQDLHAAMA
ncbi:MAG: aminotransferase class IV, partial [Chitinophagaceae bacterium]|nr:aminotransferase class IV [Chitinophagaceae bacterium]